MCGIYGTTKPFTKEIVVKKLEAMKSRGPDFSGFEELGPHLLFGHNRLAILDLDDRSNQPFFYQELSIVFNGEIYNYLELKETLTTLGYKFNTASDTEVICAAYLEYGEHCLDKLNGMFAFVIFDKNTNSLFGARDRVGKKPFYYSINNDGFEFASTLSALEFNNHFELNEESLIKYLYWNYIPEPYTPYKNVFKLQAGHKFQYHLESNSVNISKYWDLPPENHIDANITFEQAKERLKSLLIRSVGKRMLSDVPLGVFLSGGVDSSLIAAIAQSQSTTPIKTYSIGFKEKEFDESVYAKEVSEFLGTEHTQITCSQQEVIEFINNFSNYYDEPFADSSALPTLLLSKYTKDNVTVALSGDGGDETFLGYNIYDYIVSKEKVYKFPFLLRRIAANLLDLIPGGYKTQIYSRALKKRTIKDFYLSYYKKLTNNHIKKEEKDVVYLDYLMNDKKSLLEVISDFDTKTYMNGDCITKVERASMAFSLEVRSPLMDYEVIEFARTIPTNYKFQGGNEKKRILKSVLYEYLPKEIFNRRKSGFGMPLDIWFCTILREYVYDILSLDNLNRIERIVDVGICQRMIRDHMSGKWNFSREIWNLIVLINWCIKRDIHLADK